MPLNSNKKGKVFERQVAKTLNKVFDADVRRTPQSGGLSIKGDLIQLSGILSEFHWECKNQEKLNIWNSLKQAIKDRPINKIPVVVFTKNFEEEFVSMRFNDFLNLLKELDEFRNPPATGDGGLDAEC
jgi:Holliday junction resolvase